MCNTEAVLTNIGCTAVTHTGELGSTSQPWKRTELPNATLGPLGCDHFRKSTSCVFTYLSNYRGRTRDLLTLTCYLFPIRYIYLNVLLWGLLAVREFDVSVDLRVVYGDPLEIPNYFNFLALMINHSFWSTILWSENRSKRANILL